MKTFLKNNLSYFTSVILFATVVSLMLPPAISTQKVPGRMITMPGVIVAYGGSTQPDFCVFPSGQVLAQATYPTLWTIYGTTYNTGGEGAGNFRMPDLRGRTIFGDDDMGGSDQNRITAAVAGFEGSTLGASGGSQLLHQHTHVQTTHNHTQDTHNHTQDSHGHTILDSAGSATEPSNAAAKGFAALNTTQGSYIAYNAGGAGIAFIGSSTATNVTTVAVNQTTVAVNQDAGTGATQNIPPGIVMNWCVLF